MPITSSAKKALRQSGARQVRNNAYKKAFKKSIEKLKKTLQPEDLSLVYQKLDKAVKANVIKKNKAARLKSRLAHLIAKSSKAVS
jgi:ribosomal protein S20